jgi:hypothetical protein
VLSALVRRPIPARITGPLSSGTFPWIEVNDAAGGTFTDGSRTGVAYERNGQTSDLTNLIVDIIPTSVGTYLFDSGECP